MASVTLLLLTLPRSLGSLNNLGLDVDGVISQQLLNVRRLIWVDVRHFQKVSKPGQDAIQSSCHSSDGPCYSLLNSMAPKNLHGLLPPSFLGPGAKVTDEIRQSEFLNAVVTAETFSDQYTLHDSLRTLSQLKYPERYRHMRTGNETVPNKVTRGSLDLAAWISKGKPLPLNNRYSLGLPKGTVAHWTGPWQTWGNGRLRLAGIAGHIRFSQRMLVTNLHMESCGDVAPRTVLVVGRQGLSVAWTRVVPLADCLSQGEFDIMSFNATLLSVDELFFAVSGGTGLCLGSLSGSVFAEHIQINSNVVEASNETTPGVVTDIEHMILLLSPDRLSGATNLWNFRPVRVSSSALARLLPVSLAISGESRDGEKWKLMTFSHQQSICAGSGSMVNSEAARRALALVRGDGLLYPHSKPRPPKWSNATRVESRIFLDEILKCHSGALAARGASQLCNQSALVRDTLLSADWEDLSSNSSNNKVDAQRQQRALDLFAAVVLQERPPCQDREWPSTPKDQKERTPEAVRRISLAEFEKTIPRAQSPKPHAQPRATTSEEPEASSQEAQGNSEDSEAASGELTDVPQLKCDSGCSEISHEAPTWLTEALALFLGGAFYVILFCVPRCCSRSPSTRRHVHSTATVGVGDASICKESTIDE